MVQRRLLLVGVWLSLLMTGFAFQDQAVPAESGIASPPRALRLRMVEPPPSRDILFNPGMGLYLAGGSKLRYQPPPDAWALSLCDIVYFRPVWSDLEEQGPASDYDAYFDPIFDFWVNQRGKRSRGEWRARYLNRYRTG